MLRVVNLVNGTVVIVTKGLKLDRGKEVNIIDEDYLVLEEINKLAQQGKVHYEVLSDPPKDNDFVAEVEERVKENVVDLSQQDLKIESKLLDTEVGIVEVDTMKKSLLPKRFKKQW